MQVINIICVLHTFLVVVCFAELNISKCEGNERENIFLISENNLRYEIRSFVTDFASFYHFSKVILLTDVCSDGELLILTSNIKSTVKVKTLLRLL